MITTLTLQEAITQVFGLKNVPEFRTVKPFKEAREWLDRQGIDYTFDRTEVRNGIASFAFGAGQPQYGIINDDAENLKGATIHGILSPRSKSQERRIKAMQEETESTDVVEEPPVIENAPEQSEPEMTVTDEKPKRKSRRTRRSK